MALAEWLMSSPIAHRGLHDEKEGRPENSLSAFALAADFAIPFELDVQLTGDGTPVVIHDRDVERMTGKRIPVAELNAQDLERLRLESSDEFIPKLADVLKLVNGRTPILIDVRRWDFGFDGELARRVVSDIRGYAGPLALQSFDPITIGRLARELRNRSDSSLPIGQVSGVLHSAKFPLKAIGHTMVTNWLTRPDFITFELAALPSRYAEYWRNHLSIPLIAFTTKSPEDEQCAKQFADNFLFDGYVPNAYRLT